MPRAKTSRPQRASSLFKLNQRSPVRPLMHALANSLEAMRLRLRLLRADASCMSTQGENIEALARILDEAVGTYDEIHRIQRSPELPRRRAKPSP